MPFPSHCPNPDCPSSHHPPKGWLIRFGSYPTHAHGTVRRYRCKHCGKTFSDQTESLHYFAKRRLPLKAIAASLLEGASLREVGRRYNVSPMAVQQGVLRLGRQAMAAQLILLHHLAPRLSVAVDGLRSFVTSQDYPCDITTTVEAEGETILAMTHSVFRRGGRMRPSQRRRMVRKNRCWTPPAGRLKAGIALLFNELWNVLRPSHATPVTIDTDNHPFYAAVLRHQPEMGHFTLANQAAHKKTSGSAARTLDNPLFPVNYVDRLMRHRLKEHIRETIAFGRNSVLQMHRAWLFAWDHNFRREHRVRKPAEGVHAEQGCLSGAIIRHVNRSFFERRLRPPAVGVPETIRQVWMGELVTPPIRWKRGQKGSSIRISDYSRADLLAAYQHAC